VSNEIKPPIILFGNTRSGTTIVQEVMSAHPDIVGWYEPSELWLYASPGRPHDEFDERDATEKVKQYIRKQFLKFQQDNGNCTVFEKTPKNIFKISYVRAIFPEAKFLYMVRNPFSFISSVDIKWQKTITGKGILRRLKSTPITQLHYYLANYLVQQYNKRILRRKYLSIWGPRYKGIQEDLKTHDQLTVIARQWAIGSKKAAVELDRFDKGLVLSFRYEDFVEHPVALMEQICAHCGFEMTAEIVKAAKEQVKSDRQTKWQRFNPHELARILPEIHNEMERHGYEIPDEIAKTLGKVQNAKSGLPVTLDRNRMQGD
jgi:hypothetical protein